MKKLSVALFAFALAGMSTTADAKIIAGKLVKNSNGLASMVLLSDETSEICDKEFPGSKFAGMDIAVSRTAQVLYRYPGCYAMREPGVLSISFWDAETSQWTSYMSNVSYYQKTPHFKEWPGEKKTKKSAAVAEDDAEAEADIKAGEQFYRLLRESEQEQAKNKAR